MPKWEPTLQLLHFTRIVSLHDFFGTPSPQLVFTTVKTIRCKYEELGGDESANDCQFISITYENTCTFYTSPAMCLRRVHTPWIFCGFNFNLKHVGCMQQNRSQFSYLRFRVWISFCLFRQQHVNIFWLRNDEKSLGCSSTVWFINALELFNSTLQIQSRIHLIIYADLKHFIDDCRSEYINTARNSSVEVHCQAFAGHANSFHCFRNK